MTDGKFSVQEMPALQIYTQEVFIDTRGFRDAFHQLYETVKSKGYRVVGPPLAIYLEDKYQLDVFHLDLALPVAGEPAGSRMLAGGPAAVALHVGPYEGLAQTYAELATYMKEQNLTAEGLRYNIYMQGAEQNPDGSEWITKVVCPIASPDR